MSADPELEALVAERRQEKLKKLGGVVAVVALVVVGVVPFERNARAALEAEGYEDLAIDRAGVFDFTWNGTRDLGSCEGQITIRPGHVSRQGTCRTVTRP